MRRLAVLLLGTAALAVFPAEAAAFHFTNKLSMTASLTDNWSVSGGPICTPNGTGSVTLSLNTNGTTRFRPEFSKSGGRPVGTKLGIYVLAVPVAGGTFTHMGPRHSSGSLTTVDNTTPLPDPTGEIKCDPIDKSQCGTAHIGHAFIEVAGYDPHELYGHATVLNQGFPGATTCQIGQYDNWIPSGNPTASKNGKDAKATLFFKAPSVRSVRRKHTTVLTQTTHEVVTYTEQDADAPRTFTDDITRTITVTINKL